MTWSTMWSKRVGAAFVVSSLAVAGLTATLASGSYKGKTSKGLPVNFSVKNGEVQGLRVTVHALCMSAVAESSYPDSIVHHITPWAMKLSADGTFKADYHLQQEVTTAEVDGKLNGKFASGHFKVSYSKMGVRVIYSCQDEGTWKATIAPPEVSTQQ